MSVLDRTSLFTSLKNSLGINYFSLRQKEKEDFSIVSISSMRRECYKTKS